MASRQICDRVGPFRRRKSLDAQLAPYLGELLNGRRPVDVRRNEKGLSPLFSQVERQLPGGGRLAGALKAEEHDRDRRGAGHIEGLVRLAQKVDHLVVDDLDELLAGGDARHHLFAQGLLLHPFEEVLRHLVVDVRLKEGYPHFAQRVLDVALAQLAVALHLLEYYVKSFL